VEGVAGGAVYDLGAARMLLLDEWTYSVVRQCEDNTPIESIHPYAACVRFTTMLYETGFGLFEPVAAFVDKVFAHAKLPAYMKEPRPLRRVDLTITDRCDLSCSACPRVTGQRTSQACLTCLRRASATPGGAVDIVDPATLVEYLHEDGTSLHIRGGNPFLEWDRLWSIGEAARRRPAVMVRVTTPGTGAAIADVVALGRSANICFNLVMFTVDSRRGTAGCGGDLVEQQIALADQLRQRGVRFSVVFLLTGVTNPERATMRRFSQDRWGRRPKFAMFDSTASLGLVVPTSPLEFSSGEGHFGCLDGICELASDGGIYPCAGVDSVCGHLSATDPMMSISNAHLGVFWELSKEDIHPCRRCALRAACVACAGTLMSSKREGAVWSCDCRFASTELAVTHELPKPYPLSIQAAQAGGNKEVLMCPVSR